MHRLFFVVAFILSSILQSYAQKGNLLNKIVKAGYQEEPLGMVISDLSNQAHFDYAYNANLANENLNITLLSPEIQLIAALDQISNQSAIDYKIKDDIVIFFPKSKDKSKPTLLKLNGKIIDEITQNPVANAVLIDDILGEIAKTDAQGEFSIIVPTTDFLFQLKALSEGYEEKKFNFKLKSDQDLTLGLKPMPNRSYEILAQIEKSKNLNSAVYIDLKLEKGTQWKNLFVPKKYILNENPAENLLSSPVQFSVIPIVSTNGPYNRMTENSVSFNLYAGYAGGLNGVEVSPLANFEKYDVKGFQMAGLCNITGGNAFGCQISGLTNVATLRASGLQISGFANVATREITGCQIAGFTNSSSGKLKGLQIGGFGNFCQGGSGWQISGFNNHSGKKEAFSGFQLSGFYNLANNEIKGVQFTAGFNWAKSHIKGLQFSALLNKGEVSGAQISSLLNISGSVDGFQFSMINLADTLSGVQIGLFNAIKHQNSGISIGLLSFIKNGYQAFDMSYNEIGLLNLNFKTGQKAFYNILGFGWLIGQEPFAWTFSYGIGSNISIVNKLSVNTELHAIKINLEEIDITQTNFMGRFIVGLNYQFSKHFEVFANGSLSMQFYEEDAPNLLELTRREGLSIKNYTFGDTRATLWWGGSGGLRFIF